MRQVQVSEQSLLNRVNRQLNRRSKQMFRNRPSSKWLEEQGRFYVVDMRSNSIQDTHCDLEAYAKKIGAMEEWETMAQ